MPITKHHCSKCNHAFGDAATASRCEKQHQSIIRRFPKKKIVDSAANRRSLNNPDVIVKIEEKFGDLEEFPNVIIVTLVNGKTISYKNSDIQVSLQLEVD